MGATFLVPLKLEMEPFPVLVWTSALNAGLFPKLTAFTFLTHTKNYLSCACNGDGLAEKSVKKRDCTGGGSDEVIM